MPNWSRSRTETGQGAARVTPTGGFVDLEATADGGDVGRSREELRRTRLLRLVVWGGPVVAYLWYRILVGRPAEPVRHAAHRPDGADAGDLLRRPHRGARRPVRRLGPVAAPDDPAGADRRPARRRRRHRHRQGRGREVAPALPGAPQLRARDGRPAAARPALRGRSGHRQDVHRQGARGRGRRAVPLRHGDVVPVRAAGCHGAQGAQLLPDAAQGGPQARRRGRLHRRVRRDRPRPHRHVGLDVSGTRDRRAADDLRRPGGPADVVRRRPHDPAGHHDVGLHRRRRPRLRRQRAAGADAVVRGGHADREAVSARWSTR